MTTDSTVLIADLIGALKSNNEDAVVALLSQAKARDQTFAAMMRTAIFHSSTKPFYYRKLLNEWTSRGRPPLKSTHRTIKIELISDGTVDGLLPYLELFAAAYGLDAKITVAPYDSVEQIAFSPEMVPDGDITFVILSDYWLKKRIGSGLTSRAQIADAKDTLGNIIDGLAGNRTSQIVVGNFGFSSWPSPGTAISTSDGVGHSVAVAEINNFLSGKTTPCVHILDTGLSVHLAGGAAATARLGYLRARAVIEERGLVQLAREAVSGIAHLFGRSHRALLTDWDNTLWGGEVGEVGFQHVVCGQDTADALGYYVLQSYLVELNKMGVILAAISRNDPSMVAILDENSELALRRINFSSFALSWGDKSESVTQIETELNFGTDLMVYVDDNPVDLAEVMVHHPEIDILLAGPTADYTLARLSSARYFNALRITHEDTERAQLASTMAEQNRQMKSFKDPNEFLRSLEIRLSVTPITESNAPRVLQLLQKTNQFNLTTRRHGDKELSELLDQGANAGVFSYTDKFGSQGIIGLMIVIPRGDECIIDTWLMSCRVLNRSVEKAMMAWVCEQAGQRQIVGHYVPTKKNSLVRGLYETMGFSLLADSDGAKTYGCDVGAAKVVATSHSLELIYER